MGNAADAYVSVEARWKALITSEPHSISKEHLKALIEHCDEYDIDLQIDAQSLSYSGNVIRILFKKGQVRLQDAAIYEPQEPEV